MLVGRRKRWFAVLALALGFGLAYGGYAVVRQRRADRLMAAVQETLRKRDFVRAHAELVEYLRARPGDADAHLLAAQTARRAQFLELFSGPIPELLKQAAAHLDDCARLHGSGRLIAAERLLLRAQQGELTNTEPSLRAFIAAGGPYVPLVLEGLIHGYHLCLNFDKTRAAVAQLLELEPENVQALLWRGRIRDQFWQSRAAREDYATSLRLNPDFDAARYYLAEALLRARRTLEAASHLRLLHDRLPDNLLVRLAWARCQVARGEAEAGCTLLDAWLAEAPPEHARRIEALIERANAGLALDRSDEGEVFARKALEISPRDRSALYSLYRSLTAQGRRHEAEQVQAQLDNIKKDMQLVTDTLPRVPKSPNDLSLRQQVAEAYLRLGREGEALVWFMGILDRNPRYRPTLTALADYYERTGDLRRAASYRGRMAAGDPRAGR